MSIHINYSAMFSDVVGDVLGLGTSELNSLTDTFTRTHTDIVSRHSAGRLPFWDLPFDMDMINHIKEFSDDNMERFDDFIQLGIGGSALGPIALHGALNHLQHNLLPREERQGCRFFCPDNSDPDLIRAVLSVIRADRCVFNVVSKSGGTAETVAQLLIALDYLKDKIGDGWKDHLILTTDPVKGLLRRLAEESGVTSFPIDPQVGGRFSLLTPVGLLPAAMTGIDIEDLCAGARSMKDLCFKDKLEDNPAALLAGLLYLAQKRLSLPIHVFFAYSNRLYHVADWFRQLWAESLGKRYSTEGKEVFTGPTPVKAIGATDQHSQVQLYVEGPRDKVFLMVGTRHFDDPLPIPVDRLAEKDIVYLTRSTMADLINAERLATTYALTKAGRPNISIELDAIDAGHIGALMYLFEAATLYAGGFYDVNPLDQPGVEEGKKATFALMGREGYEEQRKEIEEFFEGRDKEMELPL